jgi:opacity protein-like surface antigen
MKTTLIAAALALCASAAFAQDTYNPVPSSDRAMYNECISTSNKNYTGGADASPIKGQNRAQAFCTCLWNETPDDFKGSLAKFADTAKGKNVNKTCEKYSGWES